MVEEGERRNSKRRRRRWRGWRWGSRVWVWISGKYNVWLESATVREGMGGSDVPHWLENDFNSSLKSQSAQKWRRCPGCHLRSLFMHNKIGKVPIQIAAWKAHFCCESSFNSAENEPMRNITEKSGWNDRRRPFCTSSFIICFVFLESSDRFISVSTWIHCRHRGLRWKMLVNDSTWMIYVVSVFEVCIWVFDPNTVLFFFSLTCTKCYLNDKDRRQALKKETKQNLMANKPHYDEGSYRYTDCCVYYINFASTSYKRRRAG